MGKAIVSGDWVRGEYLVGLTGEGKSWACENVGYREEEVGVAVVAGKG